MSESPTTPFPSPEELGAFLRPYAIQECTYVGHWSAIYRAQQVVLERQVMIRVMHEPEPELVSLLLDGLRKRARLVDPRIVSIFDFGRAANGLLYLVTEHVDGGLLESLLLEKKVAPKHAFLLAIQLCDALQIVHDQQIVHGALSCRTVLVTDDWQLKLTGIGMSETADGELYWQGESYATFSDDIYHMGIVIHAMFTGRLPADTGELSASLPPAFAQVVLHCMTGDLTQRYPNPRAVRTALMAALQKERQVRGIQVRKSDSPAGGADGNLVKRMKRLLRG